MKNLRVIPSLLAALLVVSTSVAQTAGAPSSGDLSGSGEIDAARTKYLEKTDHEAAAEDSQTEAQLRSGAALEGPCHGVDITGRLRDTLMADSDPSHALIGGGIGFAIGATLGAVAAVSNGKPVGNAVFIGGSLFGLAGAVIGASHGTGHSFVHRRRTYPGWPEEDEEGNLRSPASQKNSPTNLPKSGKPALPSEPHATEASTAAVRVAPLPEEHSADASSPETQEWHNFSGQLKPW